MWQGIGTSDKGRGIWQGRMWGHVAGERGLWQRVEACGWRWGHVAEDGA